MGLFKKLKKLVKKADPIGSKLVSKSPVGKKLIGSKTGGSRSGVGRLENAQRQNGSQPLTKPGIIKKPLQISGSMPPPTTGGNAAQRLSRLAGSKRRTGRIN